MRTKNTIFKNFLLLILFLFNISFGELFAQNQSITFTQSDRDRLTRMEEQIKALSREMNTRFDAQQKEMNARFEGVNTKFEGVNTKFEGINTKFEGINNKFEAMNDKIDKLYTLMYFILGGVFGLIGLIFWDRRSYINPLKEDIKEIRTLLREYSLKQPELAEILRTRGIL